MTVPAENFNIIKQKLTEHLEERKLRKTPERFAILEEIYSADGHFDVEALYVGMQNKNYRVSRATVYNTLEILMECDLVKKHQFGKNQAQFEKSFSRRQHDHLICTHCHRILEFCDPRVQAIQKTISDIYGFTVKDHSLHFYGECNDPNCEVKIIND
jgi:Fur family ferric uptake transcriptional regulator